MQKYFKLISHSQYTYTRVILVSHIFEKHNILLFNVLFHIYIERVVKETSIFLHTRTKKNLFMSRKCHHKIIFKENFQAWNFAKNLEK